MRLAPSTGLEDRLEEMKGALASRGVVITSRRARVLEVLLASDRHPSVGEVHREVRDSFPRTSLATVYNTIELLKETGQVLEIEFSGAANRYDGRRPESHPHLICVECERFEDLEETESVPSLNEISRATGYEMICRRLDYYGVCPNCRESG